MNTFSRLLNTTEDPFSRGEAGILEEVEQPVNQTANNSTRAEKGKRGTIADLTII